MYAKVICYSSMIKYLVYIYIYLAIYIRVFKLIEHSVPTYLYYILIVIDIPVATLHATQ